MERIEQWAEPPGAPPLGHDEVHVWLAHLSAANANLASLRAALSTDEISRAEKFHFHEHRERWQTARGILRLLLARYLKEPATEIAFDHGAQGKPKLKYPANSNLHFNTSHSGDFAVFAFTRAGEVGVDIECVRNEMPRRDDIVRRYFAPGEQRQLFALPEPQRTHAFFKLWTRKEAFVKARGTGLFSGLENFEVSLDAPRVVGSDAHASEVDWWMAELPPVPGYEGAVVASAKSCTPRFLKWSANETAT
ncbi:MAG TPA: 4'-phosphopantetheinyl transferase superfamily protein [Verrucomicrobiae bacterium]